MLMTASAERKRLQRAVWIGGLGALCLAGCIVDDGDAACGDNQVRVDGEGTRYCQCAPGYIIDVTTNSSCTPCGENEEVDQGKCACKQGYTRPSEGAACMMSALGGACSDDNGCSGDFPTCADGYCTSACTASTDCEPHWVCDAQGSGKVCKKPPQGYGMSCETSAECAGNEAAFCEAFRSHTCQVQCSQSAPCPGDWGCCDFAVMVICIEPASLVDGACPPGGKLVTP